MPVGGEFRLRVQNAATSTFYLYQQVLPVAARTSYSASLATSGVPAGSYKAFVYYRPAIGTGSWTATGVSSAFKVTPINITAPVATSSWKKGSTQTVTWTVNPAYAFGEFRVWLVNAAGSGWYVNKQVLPTAGKTSYSAAITVTPPAAAGNTARVYWRATVGSGAWTATARSAAFTVTP